MDCGRNKTRYSIKVIDFLSVIRYNINMYVEDYLEILSSIHDNSHKEGFKILPEDQSLMFSLARQTFRGTPLTDRQLELSQKKLIEYKAQFLEKGYNNFDTDITSLRMPLREIDRSKTITFVKRKAKNIFLAHTKDEEVIELAIKFPFSKKMIKHIEFLQSLSGRDYDKRAKTHYLNPTPDVIFKVVDRLIQSNFDIASDVKEIYMKIKDMNDNQEDYAPGVYGFKLKNLHHKAYDYAVSSIGEPTKDNLVLYKDRENTLGLKYFDEVELQQSVMNLQPLTKRLLQRDSKEVLIDSSEFTFNNVVETILELYRIPILMIIPDSEPLDFLSSTFQSFRNIIANEDISVLFRQENKNADGREFNKYVKSNFLNNPIDNNTKIVYINNNKLPKPLVQSGWLPEVAIRVRAHRLNRNVATYLNITDLVIHYDDVETPWGKQKICKI